MECLEFEFWAPVRLYQNVERVSLQEFGSFREEVEYLVMNTQRFNPKIDQDLPLIRITYFKAREVR